MQRSYRIPAHVLAANLADESVLLQLDTQLYYQLNETGQYIWKRLEQSATATAIVAGLVAVYDVTAVVAAAEYRRLTDELAARGLIEPLD